MLKENYYKSMIVNKGIATTNRAIEIEIDRSRSRSRIRNRDELKKLIIIILKCSAVMHITHNRFCLAYFRDVQRKYKFGIK